MSATPKVILLIPTTEEPSQNRPCTVTNLFGFMAAVSASENVKVMVFASVSTVRSSAVYVVSVPPFFTYSSIFVTDANWKSSGSIVIVNLFLRVGDMVQLNYGIRNLKMKIL